MCTNICSFCFVLFRLWIEKREERKARRERKVERKAAKRSVVSASLKYAFYFCQVFFSFASFSVSKIKSTRKRKKNE